MHLQGPRSFLGAWRCPVCLKDRSIGVKFLMPAMKRFEHQKRSVSGDPKCAAELGNDSKVAGRRQSSGR